jgi:hypothetical protein
MMLGGLAWMTSDHIRNSFHIAWSSSMKADVELPIWMDYLLSSNILLLGSAFTHLLLQALPILAIIYPFSKFHRNFEGTAYAISCVFLWAFMGYIWPWYWWLAMAAIFFAYDKRDVVLSVKEAPAFSIESWYGVKYAFVVLFIFGFLTQIPAIRLNAFPFIDALSFYAVPYDTYPFDSKVARIIPIPSLTMDSQECIGKQSCLYKKRHLPTDKNSPVYFTVSSLSGEEQLKILEWCSKKSNTFCSSSSVRDRALWTGFYNADTQDFELVYAGVTALHTASGKKLTVKYLSNNHRVEFSGSLIDQIDRVQVVELSSDRTHMNEAGGDISLDGSGLNLPKTSSCLIGLVVSMKDGRKIPFLGATLCLWRKV